MIRLAVDTAFEQLSMALIENNTTLARYHSADRRRNASILFQKLDELMVMQGLNQCHRQLCHQPGPRILHRGQDRDVTHQHPGTGFPETRHSGQFLEASCIPGLF